MSSPVTLLNDFSDRISPMLVKELRQGLRAKTFVVVFLSLQIALGTMLLSASAATSDQAGSVISGIIFAFFAIAALIIQPLRGVSALSSEIKGNTIDMMVLTRLSAWRIVFGKWIAIIGQSVLLLATIIPYLILRYFFGGMNLFAEMVMLALLFLTSMALTAFTVGLSASNSVIVKSLIPILGTLLLFSAPNLIYRAGSNPLLSLCALDSGESRTIVSIYVIALTYLGGSALSLGASLIAPAAENHSTLRRVIAIGMMFPILPFIALGIVRSDLLPVLLGLIMAPALAIALTESAPFVRSVCAPFARRGMPGKLAALFFLPGWPSGVFFSILMIVLAMIATGWQSAEVGTEIWIGTLSLSLLGWLLFPAAVQVLAFKGEGQRIAQYLLLLIATGVLTLVLSMLTTTMSNPAFLWFFVWNPLTFLPMMEGRHVSDNIIFNAAALVDLLLLLILLTKASMAILQNRRIIEESETAPGTP